VPTQNVELMKRVFQHCGTGKVASVMQSLSRDEKYIVVPRDML
jgi:UDP-N-acetylglucosamine transferase subunit ALG13